MNAEKDALGSVVWASATPAVVARPDSQALSATGIGRPSGEKYQQQVA